MDRSHERNWVEKWWDCSCIELLLWPRVVHKWLNIPTNSSDYSADSDDSVQHPTANEGVLDKKGDDFQNNDHIGLVAVSFLTSGAFPRSRRRKSETFRAQLIDSKELRVSANTWNVGGEVPPEDLDIRDWLDTDYPADIYVIGFQEIIPLNAGNIFGSEDDRPIPIWENIIRGTLNNIQPEKTKTKCYSHPPSPSRLKPSEYYPPNVEHETETMLESETDTEVEITDFKEKVEEFVDTVKDSISFKKYHPLETYLNSGNKVKPEVNGLAKLDIDRKRKPQYVRVVSKQMVGVFITIWVRRSLRKHIQNVNVSTVGVGVMGYIGNKGSISVSMSIYQTNFCFICTHLTSGERDVDIVKRNADVDEIYKRTRFNSTSNVPLPRSIKDHERIIWLGDLNYRFNLSYEETRDLISKNAWSQLLESDQLRIGGAFDGWTEGTLNFPPTYKYEPNSDIYYGEDPKVGRRTPAWCDRILSYGKGMQQLSYKRAEIRLSDHRPVSASYIIEVEAFSLKKLQRALTVTNAEMENYGFCTVQG
ncbi:type IV inositol polyphosphate 5-phosphatase 3-like [Bidens hawaiensis]|uniref:type IV inositol polyphosphate 5-phosphatase 3-like n=1 Tax=Bidens hawaiensis TaxID=980011 RepID=UPI00404A0F69